MTQNFNFLDLSIMGFRGLHKLHIKNCGRVNLFLGDNNCGKTSIFEAIQLFKDNSINNLLKISSGRTDSPASLTLNDIDFLFPYNSNEINITATTSFGKKQILIKKEIKNIIFNKEVFLLDEKQKQNSLYSAFIDANNLHGQEIKQMLLSFDYFGEKKERSLIQLDLLLGNYPETDVKHFSKITYQSPFQHFHSSQFIAANFGDFVKNEKTKVLLVELLKLFDPSIIDILLLPSESLLIPLPEVYIKDSSGACKPLSTYGDGMKKALELAISSIHCQNGVLLIDEIETSLHHKYFHDLFTFLISIAEQLKTQLFISTHSEETIDSILKIVNSEEYLKVDTRFFTLKQKEGKTLCRALDKSEALTYREKAGIEVRD